MQRHWRTEFLGEEITRAFIDIKDNQVADNILMIYELKNREHAEQLFLEQLGKGNEIDYFEPDDQTKIPVYKTPFNGLAKIIIPGFAAGFDDTYFIFYDLGVAIGPLLFGMLLPLAGYRKAFALFALITFACIILYYYLHGKKASIINKEKNKV